MAALVNQTYIHSAKDLTRLMISAGVLTGAAYVVDQVFNADISSHLIYWKDGPIQDLFYQTKEIGLPPASKDHQFVFDYYPLQVTCVACISAGYMFYQNLRRA